MFSLYRFQLVVCVCSLFCFAAESSAADVTLPTPTISVSGSAELRASPDEVILTAAIESRAKELNAAVDENDAKISKVLEFLKASGVGEPGIRTETIQIESVFARQPSAAVDDPFDNRADPFGPARAARAASATFESVLKPIGYVVTRRLSIRTDKLPRFETIYRGLIERGINQISGIEFRTTKLREYRDRARIEAIRAAKEKAVALAGELGAKLAGVQTINESNSDRYSRASMQMQNSIMSDPFGSGETTDTAIAAGEIQINATVNVVFRLGSTEFP